MQYPIAVSCRTSGPRSPARRGLSGLFTSGGIPIAKTASDTKNVLFVLVLVSTANKRSTRIVYLANHRWPIRQAPNLETHCETVLRDGGPFQKHPPLKRTRGLQYKPAPLPCLYIGCTTVQRSTPLHIEVILEPKELTQEARPRIISDNGPQFIAKDFQGVHSDLGHDPSQNIALLASIEWKIERWHKSLKGECIRPGTPLTLEDARRLVEGYVEHYNNVRLKCVWRVTRRALHFRKRHAPVSFVPSGAGFHR